MAHGLTRPCPSEKILRPNAGDFWYTVGAFAARVRCGGYPGRGEKSRSGESGILR